MGDRTGMTCVTMASRLLSTTLIRPPPPACFTVFSSRVGVSRGMVKYSAMSDDGSQGSVDGTVYQGVYGPWTIEPSDVREVILYRSGLVTAAASFVAASSAAFLPGNSWLSEIINQNHDWFYLIGAAALGLSLFLIHIYVTEIKRTLQAMWALGVVGSLAAYVTLARPASDNLVHYVVDHPTAVWFVGPLFAALTGLVFKEGLCYGKLEAALLTFIIPSLLLGHLTGLMNDEGKLVLLGTWMALFVVFAGRKFTQPIKDDIGDKSVFMFMSLSEDEKKAVVLKLELEKSRSIPFVVEVNASNRGKISQFRVFLGRAMAYNDWRRKIQKRVVKFANKQREIRNTGLSFSGQAIERQETRVGC